MTETAPSRGGEGVIETCQPDRVTAATDGSCFGSPGPGGWGWVTADGRSDWGSEQGTTHNRMELTAVLELLRSYPTEALVIQADSTYVVNIFTKWLEQWRKQNWRRSNGKPIKNLDLIKEVNKELNGRHVEWEWVKGHAGHCLNGMADRLARRGAEDAKLSLPPACE